MGKEFNNEAMDGIFAGTPPLEALRYIVHEAATIRTGEDTHTKVIMINDVTRAFFEGPAVRQVCVELPDEDITSSDRSLDKVGHLPMSLYWTRDAAMNWQEEVAREMKKWGFKRGRYNPCLYWHPQSGLMTLVHGDDFVSVGRKDATDQVKKMLEARFEIKTQIIGAPGSEGGACASCVPGGLTGQRVQEGRVINRVVGWTAEGWEMEPDQRHVDPFIKDLGLNRPFISIYPICFATTGIKQLYFHFIHTNIVV